MNKAIVILTTLFLGLLSFADQGHGSRVEIKAESQASIVAGQVTYAFKLFDNEQNKEINDQDLNESHTKKLHFIIYDAALKEFSHLHPSFDNSNWQTDINLPKNGQYFIWAQGELIDGTEFSASTKAQVINGLTENQKLPLGDVRLGLDKQTIIDLAKTKIKAGKMVMLNFKVSRNDGLEPIMTPYLGALAHVIATPLAGNELIHVHPMNGNTPNTGMIHATFPREGEYRLWVQFNDRGELKTIPLSVIVYK
ncbi:hypothetical protein K2P97_00470 [bacterium]|nr:hypothetical protein [bacterium]